jgi:hypothetical protein
MKWEPIENAPHNKPVLVTDGRHILYTFFTSYDDYPDDWRALELSPIAGRWRSAGKLYKKLTHFALIPELPKA